jgi:hypothetical protein
MSLCKNICAGTTQKEQLIWKKTTTSDCIVYRTPCRTKKEHFNSFFAPILCKQSFFSRSENYENQFFHRLTESA